jgi:uncharacterized DUF497 family protein
MRFEWDPGKAESNHKGHGVSFEDAMTVFFDPLSATFTIPTIHWMSAALSPSAIRLDKCLP